MSFGINTSVQKSHFCCPLSAVMKRFGNFITHLNNKPNNILVDHLAISSKLFVVKRHLFATKRPQDKVEILKTLFPIYRTPKTYLNR